MGPVDYDIAEALYYHGELPTPPQFRIHGQYDPITHCTGTNSPFR